MQMRALGLVMLVALFVAAGRPKAQPIEDPVIPVPVVVDNGPGTQTALVSRREISADPRIVAPESEVSVETVVVSPGTQPSRDKLGAYGTIKLPSTARDVCYLFYSDETQPAALVLWRAIGEGTKFDSREVRERISLQGGQSLKGVYVLEPDYHVQKLALNGQDAEHVVGLMQSGIDGKALAADAVWKGKVLASLKDVEYDTERSKELRKLAAQKARDARKASSKVAKSNTKGQEAKASTPAKGKSTGKASSKKSGTASVKVKTSTKGKALTRQ